MSSFPSYNCVSFCFSLPIASCLHRSFARAVWLIDESSSPPPCRSHLTFLKEPTTEVTWRRRSSDVTPTSTHRSRRSVMNLAFVSGWTTFAKIWTSRELTAVIGKRLAVSNVFYLWNCLINHLSLKAAASDAVFICASSAEWFISACPSC